MRQAADSGGSGSFYSKGRLRSGGFGNWTIAILASFIGADPLHAEDSPAFVTPPLGAPADTSADDPIERLRSADALTALHTANDGPFADTAAPEHALDGPPAAAPSTDLNGGDGWGHGLVSDGCFWFDANAGMVEDRPVADGADPAPNDSAPAADDATNATVLFTDAALSSANPSSFQYSASSAPNNLAHDPGAVHFTDAAAGDVVGITAPISNGPTANIANFAGLADIAPVPNIANKPPAHPPASSPHSDAPVLAWTGDIGSGASGGAGSAGGGSNLVQYTTAGSGLVIDIVYDSSVANAPAGFTEAVAAVVSYYESVFSNPVTITIDVGYGEIDGQPLESSALGESETYLTSVSYAQLESALVDNAYAIGDTAAAVSLPSTSPVSGQYWVSTAEAKALGLAGASTSVDGYVGFDSTPNIFAYNDSNGVPANQYDFYGVVAHEISEVMGRQMMDGETFDGGTSYEPLDLFHYSAPGVRDFSGTTAGYASPDGGKTDLDNFNTNPSGDLGDWAASAGHDSYLAFTGPGAVDAVTPSDLAVMNLLGWDPVTSTTSPPPPSPPPVATADFAHDVRGGSVSVSQASGVLGNDSDSDSSDVLSVSAVDGSSANVGDSVDGVFGTLTMNANGSYTYTNTHPGLVAMARGVAVDTFSYSISNGDGGTADSTLTVLVTGPAYTYVTGAQGSTIQGGAGLTVLDGSAGDMSITAGSGQQVLFGGPGDTLTGGSGSDRFIFAAGFGNETVNNFNTAHDVIDLPQTLFPNFAAVEADMHTSGTNTVITLDATDSITLSHVSAQSLQALNFHLIV